MPSRPFRRVRRTSRLHRTTRPALERLEPRLLLASLWRNPADALDVSADHTITPRDAVLIVNDLNELGPRSLPASLDAVPQYLDTTGDGRTAPLDALLVINHLNSVGGGERMLFETGWLASERRVTISLGQEAGTRLYRVQLSAQFDTSDSQGLAGDRLAVYLENPDVPGERLLDGGLPGTALFSWTETTAETRPGLTQFDGSILEIDLSSLATQDTGSLLFQLLSGDGDTGTRVQVRPLSNDVALGERPALAPRQRPAPPASGGPVAFDELSRVEQAEIRLEQVRYDASQGRYAAEVRLRSPGATLQQQVALVIPDLPAGVQVVGAAGHTSDGSPYLNFRPALPGGGLPVGELSDPLLVELDAPISTPFVLAPQVWGRNNQPPIFPPLASLTLSPGQSTTIRLGAFDPDGDQVTYALAGAESMPSTRLSANGNLIVAPAPGQLGDYRLTIMASDGVGETQREVLVRVVPDEQSVTRITGVVKNTADEPLEGVPLELAGFSTISDAEGRFTITLPTLTVPTEAFPIPIPLGDPALDPFGTGSQELRVRRARFDVTTGNSVVNPRQHPNLVTSYLDASVVYGSTPERAAALRTGEGGHLKMSGDNLLPRNDPATFPQGTLANDNEGREDPARLFATGDVRANENVPLLVLHTVLAREHNRLADSLQVADPSLNDEQLYQRARRLVGAILQQITYQEYLPLLLGPDALPAYGGYDSTVDPRESTLFAAAAFRLGHTQLTGEIARLDSQGASLADGPLSLRSTFFTTTPIDADGIEPFVRGLAVTPMQTIDAFVIDDVRNFLFGPPGSGGMDLAAINIQRGRDMGLPSYNQARIDFGLPRVTDFAEISSDQAVQNALRSVYGQVDQIDVWTGGIAEDHVAGSLIGPLFRAILVDQFVRTRDGDRFWYENGQFTEGEWTLIRATTLESLIERNTSEVDLPPHPLTSGPPLLPPLSTGTFASSVVDEYRSIDGSGNHIAAPELGSTRDLLLRNFTNGYADGQSAPGGKERPNPRAISNAVNAQPQSLPDSSGATSLLVFWGQLLDHDLGLTPGGVSDTLKIMGNLRAAEIDGRPYPFVAERLDLLLGHPVYPGVDNMIVRPLYLPVLDLPNGHTIDPLQDTLVTTAAIPGAALRIAAGTLRTRNGELYAGNLSITEVPREQTPATLPQGISPDLVITVQPAEMVFDTPATLTLPNRSGWAPGTLLDLYSIDLITGEFVDVGDLQVSSDGSVIETIAGGLRNTSWSIPTPRTQEAMVAPSAHPYTPQDAELACDPCGPATIKRNSAIELYSGVLTETHDLVTYQSLGETRGLRFVYDSLRADPRPIIHFGYRAIQGDLRRTLVASLTIQRGEWNWDVPGYVGSSYGLVGGEHFWSLPEDFVLRDDLDAALQIDLREQPTGLYDYTLQTGLQRFDGEQYVGRSTASNGQLVHVNLRESIFGDGWGLAGWQQLVEEPTGTVLLIDGDGTQLVFHPSSAGQYVSPRGDFSLLERLDDGTFRRTLPDGTIAQFDADHQLATVTDRHDNVTRYEYDEDRRVVAVVDPVGLRTKLEYAAGRLTTVIDPVGRTTRFVHDADGRLTSVIDPDETSRTWTYDASGRMTGEIDARGAREETFYDAAGRVRGGVRKDGSTFLVQPAQVQGLLPDQATIDPLHPATGFRLGIARSFHTDGNGNVVQTQLDQAGQMVSWVDAVGVGETLARDQHNHITQQRDARGHVTAYRYDDRGNIRQIVDDVDRPPLPFLDNYLPDPDVQFLVQSEDTTSRNTEFVDLDQDGELDVVTVSGRFLQIRRGVGNMTFGAEVTQQFSDDVNYRDLVVVDFDRDGDLDVIPFASMFAILLNDGAGHLEPAGEFALPTFTQRLAAGDLNQDGRTDIVAAEAHQVTVFLASPDGSFQTLETQTVGAGPFDSVDDLQLMDLNGDSALDLLAVTTVTNVLFNDHQGRFADPLVLDCPFYCVASSAELVDVNVDGRIDIAVVGQGARPNEAVNGMVAVFVNQGDATWSLATVASPVGYQSVEIAATDFNQDGLPDLAVGGAGTIDVLLNDGANGFQLAGSRPAQGLARLSVGDVSGDRQPDVLYGNWTGVFVVRNPGTWQTPPELPSVTSLQLHIDDLNGDGRPDLVTSGEKVAVRLATGPASWAEPVEYAVGAYTYGLTTGDIDGDGSPEIIARAGFRAFVLWNDGLGRIVLTSTIDLDDEPAFETSIVADLDGDGQRDLAFGNARGPALWARNRGDRTFEPAVPLLFPRQDERIHFLAAADFDHDGDTDLVGGGNTTAVFLNAGQGHFATGRRIEGAVNSRGVTVADLDRDGNEDLILAAAGGFAIGLGKGDGSFEELRAVTTHMSFGLLQIVDVDVDGYLDVAIDDQIAGAVQIYRGDGRGGFTRDAGTPVVSGIHLPDMALADIDADGDPDILALTWTSLAVRLNSASDPAGYRFRYDSQFNQLVTSVNSLGQETRITLDPSTGDAISIRQVVGQLDEANEPMDDVISQYVYTPQGLLDTLVDPLQRVTAYEYDAWGRLVALTSARGTAVAGVRRFEYDAAGNVTASIDENQQRTEYEYDLRNRLVTLREADPDGPGPLPPPVTHYTYDPHGNLVQFVDARGHTTNFQYDALDRLEATTDALQHVWVRSYDLAGNLTTAVDSLDRRTRYRYDARNRLLETTDPLNGTTHFTYDPTDNLVGSVNPNGHATEVQYDARRRVVAQRDALDQATSYYYDLSDHRTAVVDPQGQRTTWEYDDLGRLVITHDPAGGQTVYEYNAAGEIIGIIDELQRRTSFAYDDRGRQISQTNPDGGETASSFDPAGNLVTLRDPEGNTTRFLYDSLDRLVGETDALHATREYSYDAGGNRIRVIDRNGRQRAFTYDPLNRLIAETWTDVGGQVSYSSEYHYDAVGQRIVAADPFSEYVYSYDANGRLASASQDSAATAPTVVFQYTYDSAGNVLKRTERQDGILTGVTTYGYDAADRQTFVTQSGTGVTPKRVEFAYDAAGHMTRVARYADLSATQLVASSNYAYDAGDRLRDLVHRDAADAVLAEFHYTYDIADRLRHTESTAGTSDYFYDDNDQLVAADHSFQPDEVYSYDRNGNRTMPGYVIGAGNRLLSDGRFTYDYDAEGNRVHRTEMATGEVAEYSWDQRNRLTRVVIRDAMGTMVREASYTYDVFDRRLSQAVDPDGAGPAAMTRKRFVYDGPHVVLQFDENGHSTHRYLHGPLIDQLLADEQEQDSLLWLFPDNMGSTRVVTDARGNKLATMQYDSFGVEVGSASATVNVLSGFHGREGDQETGLSFFRHRFYDPQTGAFISEDPLGFHGQDENLYRYVHNQPVQEIDPWGLVGTETPTSKLARPARMIVLRTSVVTEVAAGSSELAAGSFVTLLRASTAALPVIVATGGLAVGFGLGIGVQVATGLIVPVTIGGQTHWVPAEQADNFHVPVPRSPVTNVHRVPPVHPVMPPRDKPRQPGTRPLLPKGKPKEKTTCPTPASPPRKGSRTGDPQYDAWQDANQKTAAYLEMMSPAGQLPAYEAIAQVAGTNNP